MSKGTSMLSAVNFGNRRGGVHCRVSVLAVAALALSACGRNTVDGVAGACGGKAQLVAEGSTTQRDAIEVFNKAWAQACPDKKVAYTPTGSLDGRQKFIAGEFDFAGSDSPL